MNRYFYIDENGKQIGIFTPEELRNENIKCDTLVWTQGMEQWKRAEEVEELDILFTASQPQVYEVRTTEEIRQPMPKTWLIESILITILPLIFCGSFLSLLGIIAIVNAIQVESYYNRGDYSASQEASRAAGRWTKITLWVFIAWIILIIAAIFLLFGFMGYSLTGIGELLNV